jgi:hypothetical protein
MRSRPRRLLEDPGLLPSERTLLEAGCHSSPVDYDIEAGHARFQASLAALAAAGAATTVAGTATGASAVAKASAVVAKLGAKLLVVLLLPAAGIAAAVHFAGDAKTEPQVLAPSDVHEQSVRRAGSVAPRPQRNERPPALRPLPNNDTPVSGSQAPLDQSRRESETTPSAPRSVAPEKIELEEETPSTSALARATSPNTARTVTSPNMAKASATPASKSPEPKSLPRGEPSEAAREMRALAEARHLVTSNPQAAIAALDALARAHPKGYFVEERRALTVLALARAKNRDLARERAASFLRTYPSSPFADRVRSAAGL